MSNKTDVLSFDHLKKFAVSDILSVNGKDKTTKVVEEHMDVLIEVALIKGEQSKQAEIDELQKRIDELQKRIDNALVKIQDDCREYGISDSLELAISILKGE